MYPVFACSLDWYDRNVTQGAAIALCALLGACGFDASYDPGDPNAPADPNDPGNPADPGDLGSPDAGLQAPVPAQMFTGTETELWRLDRDTLATERVGAFSGGGSGFRCGGIALGSDGTLYAVSVVAPSTLFQVDPDTAELTEIADLTNNDDVWGTTMVADKLILGGPQGHLYSVDVGDGATSMIGQFDGGWQVSGDLTWLDGVGLVGTLDNGGNDHLATISMTDASVSDVGDTGRGDVYGLTSTGGKLWGLTGSQEIYEMDPDTGALMTSVSGAAGWSIAAP